MRDRTEAGESLIEVILTIVLMGLTIAALVAGLTTLAGASKQHRDLTTADTVMRSYAEAAKRAAQGCTPGADLTIAYTPPPDFTVDVSPASPKCPPVTGAATAMAPVLTLSVTDSDSTTTTMQIVVRTP